MIKQSLLISILFTCLTSCKCSKEHEYEEKMEAPMFSQNQKLKLNILGDLASIHPHTGIDLMCRSVEKALFEGLTRLSREGKPEPALAQKIEISPDKKTYTFSLRPSKWSNGEDLQANHFERSWKAAIASNSPCLRSDLFYYIKNAERAKKGEVPLDHVGVKAIDDLTLQVELEHPTPYFLELIALPIFSPLYNQDPRPQVFNGPFLVQQWDHDSALVLVKNKNYWNSEAVKLEEISFSLVPDHNTALLMYEKGELDFTGSPFTDIPPDLFTTLDHIGTTPVTGAYWICCNTRSFPLTSKHIRLALSYALSREEIAEISGHQRPSYAPVSQDILPLKLDDKEHRQNLKLAHEEFQKGLEELKITREEFPTLHLSHSNVAGHKNLAEAFARSWEKHLGISCELQGYDWNTFFGNLGSRQFQLGGCVWYSVINDPMITLEFFRDANHRYNSPQWENQEYKRLLDLADHETDLAIREEHLRQAEKILLTEMPIIPLFFTTNKHLKKDRVKNFHISKSGLIDFKWTYIDAHDEAI